MYFRRVVQRILKPQNCKMARRFFGLTCKTMAGRGARSSGAPTPPGASAPRTPASGRWSARRRRWPCPRARPTPSPCPQPRPGETKKSVVIINKQKGIHPLKRTARNAFCELSSFVNFPDLKITGLRSCRSFGSQNPIFLVTLHRAIYRRNYEVFPDRPFHNFCASTSGYRQNVCS